MGQDELAIEPAELESMVRHVNVEASTVWRGDVVRHLGAWRVVRSVMTVNNVVCIALEVDFSESRVVWELPATSRVTVRKTS